jgi:uncharacterized protein (TIGR00297 family)
MFTPVSRGGVALSQDWLWFWIFLFGNLLIVGLGELLFRLFPTHSLSRKLVHALVGVAIALSPFVVERLEPMLLLGAIFLFFNGATHLLRWLPGMHAAQRGWGTVLFVIGYGLILLFCWVLFPEIRYAFTLAMLVLALADPAAALVGRAVRPPRIWVGEKTVAGSAAMFGVAFLVIGLSLYLLRSMDRLYWPDWMMLVAALGGAGVATAAEVLSRNGWDNVTVPVSVALLIGWMGLQEPIYSLRLLLGLMIGISFVWVAWRVEALSTSGAILTFLMAVTFFGLGGWAWSVPVIVFFVLSSLWSRLGRRKKEALGSIFEKNHRRDAAQVLANGGVAWACALLAAWSESPLWYAAYLGSLAAVTADTWATELGTVLRLGPTVLITNFRSCEAGTSGGVSLIGTTAAIAGAVTIWASGWLADSAFLAHWGGKEALMGLLVAGLGGSLIDSLLGALLQARFRCAICGLTTERSIHCGKPALLIGGWRWIRNDTVNGVAALCGALLGMLSWMLSAPMPS